MPLDEEGNKWSCEPCMRGHRSSKCQHFDRLMSKVPKSGRPLKKCPHATSSCSCKKSYTFMTRIPKGSTFRCRPWYQVAPRQDDACQDAQSTAVPTISRAGIVPDRVSHSNHSADILPSTSQVTKSFVPPLSSSLCISSNTTAVFDSSLFQVPEYPRFTVPQNVEVASAYHHSATRYNFTDIPEIQPQTNSRPLDIFRGGANIPGGGRIGVNSSPRQYISSEPTSFNIPSALRQSERGETNEHTRLKSYSKYQPIPRGSQHAVLPSQEPHNMGSTPDLDILNEFNSYFLPSSQSSEPGAGHDSQLIGLGLSRNLHAERF
ncbi:hypothetical protein ARAM_001684 [Aspergillus rambellii]|uniref:Copper-fist domain-containing protein n=2 Tax=Aspergillus subgen. Nidulantes TaxID=2720870 RepID=A0A0F8WW48_9EURO|nr:hypothetical protein AOCH_000536 [Aspergillus ochraceoroseus]KKK21780.1 hypothetical protein ARAM_001684 [Aspergillus rambellii]